MKAYCFNCKQFFDTVSHREKEKLIIKGVEVEVFQTHTFCPVCGEDISPDEIVDENIMIAHEAYREALGSIRISDMKKLLEMYNIGASPMSQLLDWGDNTYERQMKHTIPSKEFADQLRQLFNPINMLNLIVKNGCKITSTALNKVLVATIKQIGIEGIEELEEGTKAKTSYFEKSTMESKEKPIKTSMFFDFAAA